MKNLRKLDRPKLHLKKLMPASMVTVEPVPVKNLVEIPKSNSEKNYMRLENIRLNAEASDRRKAQIEKAKPLVNAYFVDKPIFQETIFIDDVECLRPLMISTRKTIFNLFKIHTDLRECTNTVLNDLIDEFLGAHVKRSQYIAGLIKFNKRFDLDKNPVDTISQKHKASAIKIQRAKDKVE